MELRSLTSVGIPHWSCPPGPSRITPQRNVQPAWEASSSTWARKAGHPSSPVICSIGTTDQRSENRPSEFQLPVSRTSLKISRFSPVRYTNSTAILAMFLTCDEIRPGTCRDTAGGNPGLAKAEYLSARTQADPNLGRLQARRGQARADLLRDRLDEAVNLMPRSARDKVSIDDDVVERRGVDGPSIHDIGKDDLVADDLAPGQVFGSRCQQPQSMAQGALGDTWIPHRLREEFYGWRGAGHLRTDRHPSGGLEVTKSNARVTGGHDDCGIVVDVHRLEVDR